MSEYLFAYGTLQPGHAPSEIAPAVDKLEAIGKGSVRGVLYDLGDYPGAVLDSSTPRTIFGTVFKLTKDASTLRQLDEYEGFDPKAPEESLFIRRIHPVELATGRVVKCWIYVYNRRPESEPILETGLHAKKAV